MERTKSTLQLALAADNAQNISKIVDQVKSGCGKTVLSSKVIQNLQTDCIDSSDKSLGYFFFGAHNGHLAIVKLFIATNVDVNAIGGRYSTAVATAAAQDHVEIMRELLTAGANIKLQGRSDWRSGDCRTDPLFVAALNGSAEAVKVALEHGAVDYWRLKPCSGSALTAATDAGNQAVVQELLRHRDV
ncbi:Cortactin-binding protein 2 like [Verticillium longisporum]|uniref:Cortactin-binding protein 2 like n=1 Tax=Verticillium longisporum TaxID=100787 RepID=A0A8I3AJC1_VERLO|nr:Cortactin-binding protein 2 like [Verticillium longisporum]